MSSRLLLLILAAAFATNACARHRPMPIPSFSDGGLLKGGAALPAGALNTLKGLFDIQDGRLLLGDDVAVNVVRDTLSIFSSRRDVYAILQGGCLNSGTALLLEGYWRAPKSSRAGLVRLNVKPDSLATALCRGTAAPAVTLHLEGGTVEERNRPSTAISLSFRQALSDLSGKFDVISHRGACRTIDECGYSENSIESMRQVEYFGGSMIETDIQLTRDNIPVLFHDEDLNDRLAQGEFCHGPIASFSLAELRQYCRLLYGEQIPTLEELLNSLVTDTTLKGAYLDLKFPGAVPTVIELVKSAQNLAVSQGREVKLLIGLPSQEVRDAYLNAQTGGVQCLIEESPDDLAKYGCGTWSPRFTEGPMSDRVQAAQAAGSSVYFWTIDDLQYMDYYIQNSRPNGIVTDRSGLLFHRAQLNTAAFSMEAR